MSTDSTPARGTEDDAVAAAVAAAVAVITGPDGPEARLPIVERRVEYLAIAELLMCERTPGVDAGEAEPVARAIAAGCLGEQHLWRDLRLPDRVTVRLVLEAYFEPFAAGNTRDMRWKRYIYRRLCRWDGFASCRAPSCSECSSYSECFSPED